MIYESYAAIPYFTQQDVDYVNSFNPHFTVSVFNDIGNIRTPTFALSPIVIDKTIFSGVNAELFDEFIGKSAALDEELDFTGLSI